MLSTFYGTKLNTSQAFDALGNRLVITNILVEPLTVTQVKTKATDGYHALQVAIGKKSSKSLTKPLKNHLKKAKLKKSAPLFIHEIRLTSPSDFKVGDQVSVKDVFKLNDLVKVTGTSKGKGFAGGMKRWGFAGGPRTHGQSDRPRSIGSIGQRTDPGRVWKGKKMPGHLGNVTKTVLKLQVVSISSDKNLLKIVGTTPGSINGLLRIEKTTTAKKPIKLYAKN